MPSPRRCSTRLRQRQRLQTHSRPLRSFSPRVASWRLCRTSSSHSHRPRRARPSSPSSRACQRRASSRPLPRTRDFVENNLWYCRPARPERMIDSGWLRGCLRHHSAKWNHQRATLAGVCATLFSTQVHARRLSQQLPAAPNPEDGLRRGQPEP